MVPWRTACARHQEVIGGDNAEAGAGGELAQHRLREHDLGVVRIGLSSEERDGEGLQAGRKMGCRAHGVIAAAGESRKAEHEEQKSTAAHNPWYRGNCIAATGFAAIAYPTLAARTKVSERHPRS